MTTVQPDDRSKSSASMGSKSQSNITRTLDFFLDDFNRTLFPLKTNLVLIKKGEEEIKDYISKCLDENELTYSFATQQRVYASKPGFHLRRTVKLDPVAEYYVYDLVYRNKQKFRKPHSIDKNHYGYRFEGGSVIEPSFAYNAFKSAISEYGNKFTHSLSLDVASYFNNIYHHDLVSWFAEIGADNKDIEGFGQVLREINSGRSVDCMPQGLYPTKMVGNDFLRFIDNNFDLKSEKLVRFMDDIALFSNDERSLLNDFQLIQKLLGEKGMSVNPLKTVIKNNPEATLDAKIDEVKKSLLKRRRLMVTAGYDDAGEEIVKEVMYKFPLSADELAYIDGILNQRDIEEDDVELILTIMRENTPNVEKRLPYIIKNYPHLIKSIYVFCKNIEDKNFLADILHEEINSGLNLSEFQLFWFAVILEEQLMQTKKVSNLISGLFNHKSATKISQAKILEISDNRFGLADLKFKHLSSGQSDWLAWASAVGLRSLTPLTIGHRMKYFGKLSNINNLISNIMLKST